MMSARKLFSPWRALVAVAAVAAAATPAKAGLSLSINGPGGNNFNMPVIAGTANASFTGSVSLAGYTINYNVTQTAGASPAQQQVRLIASVVGTSGAAAGGGQFTFLLGGDQFTTPTGPTVPFNSTLKVTAFANVNSVRMTGTANNASSNPLILSGIGTQFHDSTALLGNPFTLAASTTDVGVEGAATNVAFVSSVTVGLPEPAAFAAALSGLPCVGGVLAMARRRLRRQAIAV